ncbi:hypothetical protein X777_14915, partial [Ooceraea biroi]
SASLEIQCATPAAMHRLQHPLHLTSQCHYPNAPTLDLPNNVSNIFANETGRFTPERARDISLYAENGGTAVSAAKSSGFSKICIDSHVDSYDCFGAVSLNATMQSNVPKPYSSHGMSTHLNMPGGQWSRNFKYIAEDMQRSHYRKLSRTATNAFITNSLLRATFSSTSNIRMSYSTDASKVPKDSVKDQVAAKTTMSQKDRFRIMLKDYGRVLLVIHITVSLLSLGTCYVIITSGVDVTKFVATMWGMNEKLDNVLKTSTDFVIAYTIHKLLAPGRFMLSMAITPVCVRRLRKLGILKMPNVKKPQVQPQSSTSSSPPASSR